MKSKTVIILVLSILLIALLSLLVYFIANTNKEALPAGESVSDDEGSPVDESVSIDEATPVDEGSSLITSERRDNPTPNGGDYSEIFYFDDDGNSVDKTVATKAIIKEYKKDGTVINEIFADINK